MPTFILHTNIPKLDLELETLMHREIREIMSDVIGKSKDFILTILHSGVSMQFGETDKPAAYCEVKNVGSLTKEITSQLSSLLCEFLEQKLKVARKQIYIEFQESVRHLWGWNGGTFA